MGNGNHLWGGVDAVDGSGFTDPALDETRQAPGAVANVQHRLAGSQSGQLDRLFPQGAFPSQTGTFLSLLTWGLDHKTAETPERMEVLFWQIARPSLTEALGVAL